MMIPALISFIAIICVWILFIAIQIETRVRVYLSEIPELLARVRFQSGQIHYIHAGHKAHQERLEQRDGTPEGLRLADRDYDVPTGKPN